MLHGVTGVHRLTVSEAGYENESREVRIGDVAMDAPPITLRHPSGTLMLTTIPSGANVLIDGKPMPQVTPAQITLAPGSHTVTVQKGGRSRTQRVEVQESLIYMRIPLDQ